MSRYYAEEEEEDFGIRVRHSHSPMRPAAAVRHIERPGRQYYGEPGYLVPEHRTTIVARSRSRSRDRRPSPPTAYPMPVPQAPVQPVIINNRIYKDSSSDSEDDYRERRRSRRQLVRRSRSHSRSRSRSRSRSKDSHKIREAERQAYEAERAREEFERMRLTRAREEHERRLIEKHETQTELQNAKRELEDHKKRKALAAEEKRIKEELELQRLKKEADEAEERDRMEQIEKDAIERYKQAELQRLAAEAKRKEYEEREYRRRLQEDLIKSGLDEKAIAAISKGEKLPEALPPAPSSSSQRQTFTRMHRRHLSIETLRTFHIDYDVDEDPEFLLVKRWVPEREQDQLWKHTKYIREKRTKLLMIEDKGHHHHRHDSDFEWVRTTKKHERKRSKSPGLLMYLAGGRPA